MQKTTAQIAQSIQGQVIGDDTTEITNLNGIDDAQEGDLTFLGGKKYVPKMQTTQASAVLVPNNYEQQHTFPLIKVENPYLAFATLLGQLEKELLIHPTGIHPTATQGINVTLGKNITLDAHTHIADNAQIADNVILYPGVYIGRNTTIGKDTIIYPNTTVRENITIGQRCIIHSNVAIGSDGFGFADLNGKKTKIPQIGTITIGNDVEIGANTAIDRATCGKTTIGDRTKLDNLVQIAHNVIIGEDTTISGMTAVAGSATIGNNVTIGGASAIIGHITVSDNVIVAGKAGVTQSVDKGQVVSGFPSLDHKKNLRITISQQKLPEALRTIRNLEKRIEELENRHHG